MTEIEHEEAMERVDLLLALRPNRLNAGEQQLLRDLVGTRGIYINDGIAIYLEDLFDRAMRND